MKDLNILNRILDNRRSEVHDLMGRVPLAEQERRADDQPPARGFRAALENSKHAVALIAEVKKASPVKGVLREDFDPVAIAKIYNSEGADCISVVTESTFFQGAPESIGAVKNAVPQPVLRKDFTVELYQVVESRALGADAILLIAYALEDCRLKDFRELAEGLGMEAIVEVHCESELERAIASGARIIGVNNRDLTTFETQMEVSEQLIPKIPKGTLAISESAISTAEHVRRAQAAGARAVLIGSSLCKAPDPAAKIREIMGW